MKIGGIVLVSWFVILGFSGWYSSRNSISISDLQIVGDDLKLSSLLTCLEGKYDYQSGDPMGGKPDSFVLKESTGFVSVSNDFLPMRKVLDIAELSRWPTTYSPSPQAVLVRTMGSTGKSGEAIEEVPGKADEAEVQAVYQWELLCPSHKLKLVNLHEISANFPPKKGWSIVTPREFSNRSIDLTLETIGIGYQREYVDMYRQIGGLLVSKGVGNNRRGKEKKETVRAKTPHSSSRNIDRFIAAPQTSVILVILLVVWFYCWNKRVPVQAIGASYQTVIEEKEYWRLITATFSHLDLWHLVFNVTSLWSLVALEPYLGWLQFLRYNLILISLSLLVMFALYKSIMNGMMRRSGGVAGGAGGGGGDAVFSSGSSSSSSTTGVVPPPTAIVIQIYRESFGIGYSCVLFGWMVFASALNESFCPIPFASSYCFRTHSLSFGDPFGTGVILLKFNFGCIGLLFLTKLILPRSSFLGHFAGVLIGYGISWGLFAFVSVPLLAYFLVSLIFWNGLGELEHFGSSDSRTTNWNLESGEGRNLINGQTLDGSDVTTHTPVAHFSSLLFSPQRRGALCIFIATLSLIYSTVLSFCFLSWTTIIGQIFISANLFLTIRFGLYPDWRAQDFGKLNAKLRLLFIPVLLSVFYWMFLLILVHQHHSEIRIKTNNTRSTMALLFLSLCICVVFKVLTAIATVRLFTYGS